MTLTVRWALAIIVILLLMALIGFARGTQGRRGQLFDAMASIDSLHNSRLDLAGAVVMPGGDSRGDGR